MSTRNQHLRSRGGLYHYRRRLTDEEKAHYVAGGFRLEGSPRSEAKALRDRLGLVRRLLKNWGIDAKTIRAVLAAPSAHTLAQWQSGALPIPTEASERVEVVLGLCRRLVEPGDIVDVRPLPPLRRPGRKSLAARNLLAGGASPTSSRWGASSA